MIRNDQHVNDQGALMIQPAGNAPRADHVLGAWRAVAIVAAFFVAQIVLVIVFGFGVGFYNGLTRSTVDPAVSLRGPLMLPMGIAALAFAGFVVFSMTRKTLPGSIKGGALAPLGWITSKPADITKAALTGCALSLVYLFVLVPISPPTEGQLWGPLATAASSGGWSLYLWAVLALVFAPPIEEFVFRGVLLRGLSNALGVSSAAIIVTLVFVLVHYSELLAYWPAWVGVILVASATVLFRLRTHSLLPAIAVHASFNLCMVVTAYARAA